MASIAASVPYFSYLSQLQGITSGATQPASASGSSSAVASAATATTGATSQTTPVSTLTPSAVTATTNTTPSLLVDSLLGNGNSSDISQILSLLQGASNSTNTTISALLNGDNNNGKSLLTAQDASLFSTVVNSALTQAKNKNSAIATTSSLTSSAAQNLINASTSASLAYNQTVLQASQNVVNANSYDADGVTPLKIIA